MKPRQVYRLLRAQRHRPCRTQGREATHQRQRPRQRTIERDIGPPGARRHAPAMPVRHQAQAGGMTVLRSNAAGRQLQNAYWATGTMRSCPSPLDGVDALRPEPCPLTVASWHRADNGGRMLHVSARGARAAPCAGYAPAALGTLPACRSGTAAPENEWHPRLASCHSSAAATHARRCTPTCPTRTRTPRSTDGAPRDVSQ